MRIELTRSELEAVMVRIRKIKQCEEDLTMARESLTFTSNTLDEKYKKQGFAYKGIDIGTGELVYEEDK